MKLPPEVEFYEDVRLLVWRPRGLLNQAAVNKIITVVGELEFSLKEPFNRFADTVAADAVELNFKYIIQVSLHRRLSYAGRPPVKSVILATDSTLIHYGKCMPYSLKVLRSKSACSKTAKKPRNGSVFRSTD